MSCSIIAIGNELINGEVVDSNSPFLEDKLSLFGLRVMRVSLIPDDVIYIRDEVIRAINYSNYLFITGGLGPTEDDVTKYGISEGLGLELIQDLHELSIIRQKYLHHGANLYSEDDKQSLFPKGAKLLPNAVGIVSGFYLSYSDCHIFVLPGVPSEMRAMVCDGVMPILNKHLKLVKPDKLVVKLIGKGEYAVDKIIRDKVALINPIRWEIITKPEGVFLKFYPLNKDPNWRDNLIVSLNEHLDSYIYAYDDDSMLNTVSNLLIKRSMTLSTVESCTGGYLSKYLTDRPGSSEYFLGAIVSYSNELKAKLVGVDSKLIESYGAVSDEVVRAMVKGGKSIMGSDICLAITGIAGPSGGTSDKPVGTVWFAIIDHDDVIITKRRIFGGNRDDIRHKSVFYGLNLIRLALEGKLALATQIS